MAFHSNRLVQVTFISSCLVLLCSLSCKSHVILRDQGTTIMGDKLVAIDVPANPKYKDNSRPVSAPSYASTSSRTRIGVRNSAPSSKQKEDFSVAELLGFREHPADYPAEQIDELLDKAQPALKDLYNVMNTPMDPHLNLSLRAFGDTESEVSLEDSVREESVCRIATRTIYPREAKRNNMVVYVPNNAEFMQVLQVELCRDPEDECNHLKHNLPFGMSSVCRQKYAYKKLLYLDPLEGKMASNPFRYPSCCACHVRVASFEMRAAKNQSAASTPPSTIIVEGKNEFTGAAHTNSDANSPEQAAVPKLETRELRTPSSANDSRRAKALRAGTSAQRPPGARATRRPPPPSTSHKPAADDN